MKPLSLLLALVVLTGCDTLASASGALSANGLSLTADARAYDSGEAVTLTLRNDGDETADSGFLACTPLERESASGWAISEEGNGRACAAVIVPLEPGALATAEVVLDGVPSGTYRYALGSGSGTIATAPFEVR